MTQLFNTRTKLPEAITSKRNWLIWKLIPRPGKKPKKVPYYTNGRLRRGTQCTSEDRAQLASYAEAAEYLKLNRKFAGLGFAVTPDCGVVALDFDDVVINGVIDSRVSELCAGTYTEFSPSKTGVRTFMEGYLPSKKDNSPPPGEFELEVFGDNGFVTVTGDVTPDCALWGDDEKICPLTPAVNALYESRFGAGKLAALGLQDESSENIDSISGLAPRLDMSEAQIESLLKRLPPVLSYDPWLRVGMALHHETDGDGFEIWDTWSESIPGYDSRAQNERHWNSFGRPSSSPVTMASVLRMVKEYEALPFAAAMESIQPNIHRYKLLSSADLRALPSPKWLVKGVLPAGSFAALFGASGSGKSFLAIDLACRISSGVEWFGHRVKRAPVIYVALEGETGFQGRIRAWEEHHGATIPEDMHLILQAVCLTTPQDLKDLAAVTPVGAVVVIDTLNRASPGADENSSSDMGYIVRSAKELQSAISGTVVLIHHSGKDAAKGMRGHSSLFAALDTSIEVTRDGDNRMWKVAKSKDGKDGQVVGFALEVKDLGADEDGDRISSCVVVPSDHESQVKRKRLAPVQRQVFEALEGFLAEKVHIDEWRKSFYAMRPAHKQATNETAFARAHDTLVTSGYVSKSGDGYSVICAL